MDGLQRQRGYRVLLRARPDDPLLCRDLEAACRSLAQSTEGYIDHIRRVAFNLTSNPKVGLEVVRAHDNDLTCDTLVGRIRDEARVRALKFEHMLQEKYEAIDDHEFKAIVRCRRCGGTDVVWDEKQTRSADEGASVFCTCTTCKNRWVLR